MSLFKQILSAIDNPELEANSGQLGNILGVVQQLSDSNSNAANYGDIQSAMSIIGKFTRSALQEQRSHGGESQAQQLVNQFAGTQASPLAVQTLFNNSQIQNMIATISNKTGLNSQTINTLLPVLVPLVLNFLKTGNNASNVQAANPVLNNFLDADGDGDVDIADAIGMASRYLGR
ncbi:MAG: hypothetical protein QNJ34_22570 [Xenococcaceae cyanobacterium MO_188.B29]|nr:hypothetical protein [Xenococcaceae cyanobacterium MO_188.B29]